VTKTIATVGRNESYNFTKGSTFVLDNDTWRLARWTDRLRWWVRHKLRLGVYTRVVAVDHAAGSVTLERIRWSWLRWKWVRS